MSGSSVRSGANSAASLPDAASHSYLGPGHSTIENCHVLNPGDLCEILLYPVPDVVLFPGQTIPLRIQNRAFIHKFLTMRSSGTVNPTLVGHIGIVALSHSPDNTMTLAKVGTTMEVRSTYRQSFNDVELVVSGLGRYRFLIVEVRSESGVPIAKVRILSDNLPQFASPSRGCNPFPQWVYDQYSPRRLARIAYCLFESTMLWEGKDNVMKRWGLLRPLDPEQSVWSMRNPAFAEYEAERDPVGFSFFLCANMPVESSVVQMMLAAECVVQRLRLAISLLRTGLHKRIACARCGFVVATKQDLFNVSGAEGLAAVYVNRYGAVHQTLTVRKLVLDSAVRYQGRPCIQDTWFPGYAWTIMSCGRCLSHLGWKYTWVGPEWEDESGSSSLMSGDEDDDMDDDDFVTIEDEDEDEDEDEETGDENSLSPDAEARAEDGEIDVAIMEDNGLIVDVSVADDESPMESPAECSPPGVQESTLDDSSSSDSAANQTILQEFWGLSRASIREI